MAEMINVLLIRTYLNNEQLGYIKDNLSINYEIVYLPEDSAIIAPDILNRVKVLIVHRLTIQEAGNYKNLVFVQIYGRGMDMICQNYLQESGITYRNCEPMELIISIGEYVLLQILYWERNLWEYNKIAHLGDWDWNIRNSYHFRALKQLKVGIIGNGFLGGGVSEYLRKYEMQIFLINVGKRSQIKDYTNLKQMDYISIHLPLSVETKQCIGKEFFIGMKKAAVLINTARGGIVNERELVDALEHTVIRGASLDVTTEEPLSKSSILNRNNRIVLTPHIAGRSELVLKSYAHEIVQNIRREVVT